MSLRPRLERQGINQPRSEAAAYDSNACRERETIDTLRLVVLVAGVIDSPTAHLGDEPLAEAYLIARLKHGIRMYRWGSVIPR